MSGNFNLGNIIMKYLRKNLVVLYIFVVLTFIFCIYFWIRNKNEIVEDINSFKSNTQHKLKHITNAQNISNVNISNNTMQEAFNNDAKITNINITIAEAGIILESFGRTSQFVRIEGFSMPFLPSVSPKVQLSLDLLEQSKDKNLSAHIALLLVRYAIMELHEGVRPSSLMNRKNPIVKSFGLASGTMHLWDEISISTLINWIAKNREKFGSNLFLDEAIVTFKLEKEKEDKMQKELLRKFNEKLKREKNKNK